MAAPRASPTGVLASPQVGTLNIFLREEKIKKKDSSYLVTTCGKCLCYRAQGFHHTYIRVDEFTFTG